ncbi:hypothetical protein GCM10010461_21060 [Microbacterium aurantiacum]
MVAPGGGGVEEEGDLRMRRSGSKRPPQVGVLHAALGKFAGRLAMQRTDQVGVNELVTGSV